MSFSSVVDNQRKFFRTGETKSLEFRRKQLLALKQLLVENSDELTGAVWKDLRRRQEVTYGMEVLGALHEIDYFLENLEKLTAPTPIVAPNEFHTPSLEKDPLGVVLIISPWNYPVALNFKPAIPAIAAGNTVILKPSELAPHSSAVAEKLVAKYFDPKVYTVVTGGVPETTALLQERFDHIFYTGCPPVAKVVMAAAAKHLTPVTLELGGKCPVVVEADADIDLSAKRIAWGKWLNNGQTCLAPDYVLVNTSVKDKLVESLRKYITQFYGNDIKNSKDYSRIVNSRHHDRVSSVLQKTQGKVVIGGLESSDRDDLFLQPTVVEIEKSDILMVDEIFGPVLPILTTQSLSEAIEYVQDGEKPLAAYIFTKDQKSIKRFLKETTSGGVTVNDVIGHLIPGLPFGGVGNSGMGRYHGNYGFDTFTHEKAVVVKSFEGEHLHEPRYAPIK